VFCRQQKNITHAGENLDIFIGHNLGLLYNGVLDDKTAQGGNALTRAVLDVLPPHSGPKVIYGTSCRLGQTRMMQEQITFCQIPYALRAE